MDCALVAIGADGADAALRIADVRASLPVTPVIAITGRFDEDVALRVLREGAQDCVAVGDGDADRLRLAIRFAVERQHTLQDLLGLALRDRLTGLPNRALFMNRLSHALLRTRRDPAAVAVLFIDLDGFKPVNDALGHAVGDAVLVQLARRMQAVLRPGDTVARYGGDEFTVLCEDAGSSRASWSSPTASSRRRTGPSW